MEMMTKIVSIGVFGMVIGIVILALIKEIQNRQNEIEQ